MKRIAIGISIMAFVTLSCQNHSENEHGTSHVEETEAHDHDHEGEEEHSHSIENEEYDHSVEGHDHESIDEHEHLDEEHDHEHAGEHSEDQDHSIEEHDHSEDAESHESESSKEIIFHDENTEGIDFEVKTVKTGAVSEIINTSGEILTALTDRTTITSNSSGKFNFGSIKLYSGVFVKQGTVLGYVSGKDLLNNNTLNQYTSAKLLYEKNRADYTRALELKTDTIISEEEFSAYKLSFEQAKSSYKILERSYSESGIKIIAPESGYISYLYVSDGEYVESGAELFEISQNKRLIVRADVSQRYNNILAIIQSVNFKTSSSTRVYESDKMNGEFVSYDRGTSSGQQRQVYFEIDNDNSLLPGSFVEVWLKTKSKEISVMIPETSLLEEQGSYFVYVKTGSETYEKRYIIPGLSDGQDIAIKKGLTGGEKLVTKGAVRIKLASMSAALPSHGHAH